MKVNQISIFLENRPGRLRKVTRILGDNEINIRALSLADTNDFGILRLIVSQPEKAHEILKAAGFTVNGTEVLAVEVPDEPGGLSGVLETLDAAGINVEYMYAFLERATDQALLIFRFDDYEAATKVLTEAGYGIVPGSELYKL